MLQRFANACVRDCHLDFYDMILNCFAGKGVQQPYLYITVMGTPGIGTSMFYMYLLNRYRAEHPASTIVTASLTDQQKLKQCHVFMHGCDFVVHDGHIPILENALYM